MLSDLWARAKGFASNLWNTVKQRGTTLLTGTHYVGPFNALSPEYIAAHPPTDRVDEGALAHDLDYSRIARERDKGKVSAAEAKRLIRESDERFLRNTRENAAANPWAAALGYAGIKAKNLAEDYLGLDPNRFVTARLGMQVLVRPDLPRFNEDGLLVKADRRAEPRFGTMINP